MASKFNVDDLISDSSSPEDSNDSENDTGTAFDKEGDKLCHIFNYSSPGPSDAKDVPNTSLDSSERESQFLKKRRVNRHSEVHKENDACERTTPTRLPKRARKSVKSTPKSSTLSKKYRSPSTSVSSSESHVSSSPDSHSSTDIDFNPDTPPTEIHMNGTTSPDHDVLPTENGALIIDKDPIKEHDEVPPNDDEPTKVYEILKNISNVLNTLVERVETTESEIKFVKARLTSSSNSSDSGVKRVEVPLVVRVRNLSCSL